MLTAKKLSKKKIIILFIVSAILGFTVIIIVFINFRDSAKEPIPQEYRDYLESVSKRLPVLPDVNFDRPIFSDKKYTELREHGDLPVEIGEVGRENPFDTIYFIGVEIEE